MLLSKECWKVGYMLVLYIYPLRVIYTHMYSGKNEHRLPRSIFSIVSQISSIPLDMLNRPMAAPSPEQECLCPTILESPH